MSTSVLMPFAASRVALAVEALCVANPAPVLIHADRPRFRRDSQPFDAFPFTLSFTPLPGDMNVAQLGFVLGRLAHPRTWQLAGICAPTKLRADFHPQIPAGTHFDAWLIHVVLADGDYATRLAVPSAPEISGSSTILTPDDQLHESLRQLLGLNTMPFPFEDSAR